MAFFYPIAVASAFLILTILGTLITGRRGPLSHLPGPWYSKYTSLISKYHWLRGHQPAYVHRLHQQYGPVVRVAPDFADLCDISAKQTIYSTKEVYLKTSFYSDLTNRQDRNVFATQNIEAHRRHRRLLQGPMSETSLKVLEPIVRSRIDLAIARMVEAVRTKGFVDVYHWTLLMTTDVIGELTFGESFRTLEAGTQSQYITDLQSIGRAGSIGVAFPGLLPFVAKFPFLRVIPAANKTAMAVRRLTTYGQESMARYHRLVSSDKLVQPTVFTKVFKAEADETLTLDEITHNARAYLIGGSDTTAHTLTYLLWCVCKHSNVRDRLVKEIRTNLPAEFSDADTPADRLPYLHCVIEETLRLYSAAPGGLPRQVPAQGAYLGCYWFPGGVTVTCQAYSLHRDPTIFTNPDAFEPDRWAEGRVTKRMKDAFMAWGGGARMCIGLHLARMELRQTAALFFRNFPDARVSTAEGMSDADMEPSIHFLLSPKGQRCCIEGSLPPAEGISQ
ncbi:cytochrome P450 [Apodospora peruviana]|uniref:Cytochrome P450 n=1 Tax=Apodospora peruviana TaxID=516989 RepID=A0AAE0MFN1_9PEZI|nr:cytochrome P450 [Apodospora peruviana]